MELVHAAIEVVSKAAMHDGKGHLLEAIYLYDLGAGLLRKSTESGSLDGSTLSTVRSKIAEYENRCSTLRQSLSQQQKQQQQQAAGAPAAKDPMSDPHVRAGMAAAEKAVEADREARRLDAVSNYQEAIRQFLAACADEEMPSEARQALSEKASEYTVRAEQLRRCDATSHAGIAAPPGGSIPFHLAAGQKKYENPVKEPGFLARLGQKFHGDHRLANAWLK